MAFLEVSPPASEASAASADTSAARFRDFAEISSDWLWEMDADLRFSWCSTRHGELSGADTGAVIGSRREDLWLDDQADAEEKARHLADLAARRPFRDFRYRLIGADGEPRWISTSGKPLVAADGTFIGYRGTGRDVTAEVRALEEAEAAKRLLRRAIDSFHSGFAIYDAGDRLVAFNDDYSRYVVGPQPHPADLLKPGVAFGDLLRGMVARGFIVPPTADADAWCDAEIAKHGQAGNVRAYQTGDGRWIEAHEYVVPDGGGTVVVCHDVTEKRAAERQRRFAQLSLDATPDHVTLARPDGTFVYFNASAAQSLGYTLDEMARLSVLDINLDLSDAAALDSHWLRLKEAGTLIFESRHRRRDGSAFPVEVHCHRVILEGEEYCFVIARDISEQRAAEREQRLAQFALESLQDSVLWSTPDGRIRYANDAAARTRGYTRAELLGMTVADLNPVLRRAGVLEAMWDVFRAKKTVMLEQTHQHRDGTNFPVEIAVNHLVFEGEEYACSIVRDITERLTAQQAVAASEQRFKDFAASSSDWFFEMDADLRISWFSDLFAERFCKDPSTVLGKTRAELAGADAADPLWRAHLADLEAHRTYRDFRYPLRTVDRDEAWISVSGVPIFDADGTFVGYRGSGREVTAEVLAQNEAEAARALLADAIASSSDGFAIYDAVDRLVLYNDAYAVTLPEITDLLRPGPTFAELFRAYVDRGGVTLPPGMDADTWYQQQLARHGTPGNERNYETPDGRWIENREYKTRDGSTVVLRRDVTERKRAERQLRFSEFSLEMLQDAHFWIRKDATIVYVNEVAARTLGYTPAELLGLSIPDIDRASLPEQWPAHWAALKAARQLVFETRHRRKDGTEFPVEVRAHFLTFEGEEYNFATARDIGERKRADAALKQSRAQFRDFTYASSDWFWEMDANLVFTFQSERFETETGISPDRVIGQSRFEVGQADRDGAKWNRHREDLRARRPFKDFTYKVISNAGKELWISVSGVPVFDDDGAFIGYRGTGRQVTHEVRARQEIERLSRRNALILNAMGEGICGLDAAGQILFANKAAAEMLGCSVADMLGRSFHDSFHKPGDCGCLDGQGLCFLAQAIESGDSHPAIEETLHRWDGSSFPAELTCRRLDRNGDGTLSAVIVFRDITRRLEADEALKQSVSRQKAILDAIPDVAWLKDLDGRFLEVNDALQRLFGVGKASILGRTDADFLPADVADRFAKGDRKVIEARKSLRFEEGIAWPDGKEYWFETRKAPLFDTAGTVVGTAGLSRDITQRRKSEESLRKLSVAVEQSPTAIVVTATDGTIEYVNKAFEAVTGYTAAEAIGQNPRVLASGQTPPHVYALLWETLAAGRKWTGEFLNRRKDGTLFWEAAIISPVTDAAGQTTHFLAIKSDITQRKEAEARLRQSFGFQRASNRMLRMAQSRAPLAAKFESMLDVILTMDSVTFQARAVLFLATRRGGDLAAFASYNLEDDAVLVADAIDPRAAAYADLFDVGGVRYVDPGWTERAPYWNDSTPSGRYEAPLIVDGAATGLVAISVPADHVPTADHENFLKAMADILAITVERERNTLELLSHRDHLQNLVDAATLELRGKAEELEAALAKEKELNVLQRQFVSMASHEFRTPLAIIDSTAQRIGRRYTKGMSYDDLNERLARIRGAVARMTGLIDSTLSAARLDAGKIKITLAECAIRDILCEVCERQRQITPERRIVVDADRLPERLVADANAVDQIFTNLLSNAVKYSPHGGQVEIVGHTDGEVIRVAVTDHGLGIPEDELPRLFERFFRARTSVGISGTGIGLHLVRQLTELQGGTVTVTSVEGEGSTFIVSLPITPAFTGDDIAPLLTEAGG